MTDVQEEQECAFPVGLQTMDVPFTDGSNTFLSSDARIAEGILIVADRQEMTITGIVQMQKGKQTMVKHNVPLQSLIDHIKTATDMAPWEKEWSEELLMKHIPVKPIPRGGKTYCGQCGIRIPGKIKARFCHKCGQAVLWKEE